MEYNLKTKPLDEKTLTYYNILPESYIQQALLSQESYNNVINLITFTDNVIDILTHEYHQKLIKKTENLKEKSITLNILDTIIYELEIQAIKLYVKELLTITNNNELQKALKLIEKINLNDIYPTLAANKKEQDENYPIEEKVTDKSKYSLEVTENKDYLKFDNKGNDNIKLIHNNKEIKEKVFKLIEETDKEYLLELEVVDKGLFSDTVRTERVSLSK